MKKRSRALRFAISGGMNPTMQGNSNSTHHRSTIKSEKHEKTRTGIYRYLVRLQEIRRNREQFSKFSVKQMIDLCSESLILIPLISRVNFFKSLVSNSPFSSGNDLVNLIRPSLSNGADSNLALPFVQLVMARWDVASSNS